MTLRPYILVLTTLAAAALWGACGGGGAAATTTEDAPSVRATTVGGDTATCGASDSLNSSDTLTSCWSTFPSGTGVTGSVGSDGLTLTAPKDSAAGGYSDELTARPASVSIRITGATGLGNSDSGIDGACMFRYANDAVTVTSGITAFLAKSGGQYVVALQDPSGNVGGITTLSGAVSASLPLTFTLYDDGLTMSGTYTYDGVTGDLSTTADGGFNNYTEFLTDTPVVAALAKGSSTSAVTCIFDNLTVTGTSIGGNGSGGGGGGSGGGSGSTPAVSSLTTTLGATINYSGTTNVPLASAFYVTFNEPMNDSSVTSSLSLRCDSSGTAAFTVIAASNHETYTVTPTSSLSASTNCTVGISTTASTDAGAPLAASVSYTFATASVAVTSVTTAYSVPIAIDGSTTATSYQTSYGGGLIVNFNTAMDLTSINASTVTITCNDIGDPFTKSGSDVSVYLVTGTLPSPATCSLVVGTGVQDANGNHLTTAVTANFTIASLGVDNPPWIYQVYLFAHGGSSISQIQINGSTTGVPVTSNDDVYLYFSAVIAMDPNTVTTAGVVTMTCGGTPVAVTVTEVSNLVYAIHHASNLPGASTCTVNVADTAADADGNKMGNPNATPDLYPAAAPFSVSFVTQ